MHAGDVFEMRPHFVHLGDVEALERLVKLQVGFGNFFDALFQHARPHRQMICMHLSRRMTWADRLSALSYWNPSEESEERLSVITDETAWRFVREQPIRRQG